MANSSTPKSSDFNKLQDKITCLEKEVKELKAANKKLQQTKAINSQAKILPEKKEFIQKEYKDLYKSIFELSPAAIFLGDKNGIILDVNPAYTIATLYNSKELIGKNVEMIAGHKRDKKEIRENIKTILSGKTLNHVVESTRKDGTNCYMHLNEKRIKLLDGEYGILSIADDITERVKALKALSDSEERFRALIENSHDCIALYDTDGMIKYISPSVKKILGYSPKELLTRSFIDLVVEDELQMSLENFKQIQKKHGETTHVHRRARHKSGKILWLETTVTNLLDNPSIKAVVSNFSDITERKEAEQALIKSEEYFRSLIENSYDCIALYDADGTIKFISPAIKKILGFTPQELIGTFSFDLLYEDDKEAASAHYASLLKEPSKSLKFNIRACHKKGDVIWLDSTMTNLLENPSVNAVVTNFNDITERVKVEKEHKEQIQYLKNVDKIELAIGQSTDINEMLNNVLQEMLNIFTSDRAWFLYPCNPKTKYWNVPMEVTGENYPGAMALGQDIRNDPETSTLFKKALNSSLPVAFDKKSRNKIPEVAREQFGVKSQILSAVYPKVGEPWLLGMHQCSHERIWTQKDQRLFKDIAARLTDSLSSFLFLKDLRKSEQLFRAVTEQSGEGIGMSDKAGKYRLVNSKLCEMTGYSQNELLEMNIRELIPKKQHLKLFPKLKRGQFGIRAIKILCKNGSLFDAEISGYTVSLDKDVFFLGIVRDITDRKKVENSLRESEEKFRSMVEESIDGIVMISDKGKIIEWNRGQELITGLSKEKVINKNIWDVQTSLATLERRTDQLKAILKQTILNLIKTGTSPFGNNLHDIEIHRPDGEIRYVQNTVYAIKTESGYMAGSVSRDITEIKKADEERKKLETQIQHAQKLESLGVLSGGIAHDFNNLLTGILGNVGLAELDLPSTSPVHSNLKNIETSSIRAADLCRQLLAYSGKGKFVVKALNLNDVVHEMGTLLETSISKKVVLKYNFSKNLPAIEVDTSQIRQVIMNLIINASDAIVDKSGVISITTGAMECDDSFLNTTFVNDNLKKGIYVYLKVSDTGIGMDKETCAKIFDPFFTTKFTGRGLGLAAVLGIMRGHKGAIKIDSEPNKGTSFKVLFPSSDKDAVALSSVSYISPKWKAKGTVLIVDDEDTIRAMGQLTLEKAGFTVLTAEDGREAINIYKKKKDHIAAILLDMTMPHMNGDETFRELRLINPKVKVILSSGYSEKEATNNFTGKGLAGFLQKPYRVTELFEKLKEIIE